jgi:hypothetical protein
MKWIGIAFFGLFGVSLLWRGIMAYQHHAVWATTGGHKSGPLTPGMAVFLGTSFLCGTIYYIVASKKEADKVRGAAASKRKLRRKRY